MADHQLDLLKLFCVLYAKDSDFVPFSIGIEPSKTIANLKGAVEPKVYSTLKRMGVDATQLKLYRVKIRNEEFEGVNIKPLLSGRMSPDTELEASKELSHYFNSQTPPEGGCIHIIAEAPEGREFAPFCHTTLSM
ncbi:hypothetical protein FRC18_003458 [Serendipita sp. 400]|nr:hypothetical protein FRC18_003458 [Serendipita sp. 400]